MRDTTPDERHQIMYDLLKEVGMPTTYEVMIETFKEYQKRELMARYDEPEHAEHLADVERMATLYAEMGHKFFDHDYPAIHLLLTFKGQE